MDRDPNKLKMVVLVRTDLEMPPGKLGAQTGHAAQEALLDRTGAEPRLRSDPLLIEWLEGKYTKVVLKVKSEQKMLDLCARAEELNFHVHVVTDVGDTLFDGVPTKTVAAIGPARSGDLDALTRRLQTL